MTQSTAEIRHVVARTGFANPLTLGVLVEANNVFDQQVIAAPTVS